jgi:hypothetical protein
MTLSGAYAPLSPEFDAFLFASVGEEVNGVPLSLLSLFSQLGLEPRDEAARLSRLSKSAAAEQLAKLIGRATKDRWTEAETRTIADGLIKRLRQPAPAPPEAQTHRGSLIEAYTRRFADGPNGIQKGHVMFLAVVAAVLLYMFIKL